MKHLVQADIACHLDQIWGSKSEVKDPQPQIWIQSNLAKC